MRVFLSIILALLITTTADASGFTLKSTAFLQNQVIPAAYTCEGENVSPELSWDNPPPNTQSFALVFTSTDSSAGEDNLWVIFNISASTRGFSKGACQELPRNVISLNNFYNETGYRGPCPPDGLKHHYVFTLYALDTVLDLSSDSEVRELFIAMKHHILGQATLTGVFSH